MKFDVYDIITIIDVTLRKYMLVKGENHGIVDIYPECLLQASKS